MLKTRQLGRTRLDVGVLGLGGLPLGDVHEEIPEVRALATMQTAHRSGIRFHDTLAPLWSWPFRTSLRPCPSPEPADDLVISTKVGRPPTPELADRMERGWFKGGLNFSARRASGQLH